MTIKYYKKISFISSISFILILLMLTLTGCKKEITYITNPQAIGYLKNKPYIINGDNDSFLLDYDFVYPEFNDYLLVKKNNLYGYIKNNGQMITGLVYEKAYPMHENKAVVQKDGLHMIIDNTGTLLYTFEEGFSSSAYFQNDYLVVSQGTKKSFFKYQDGEITSCFSKSFDYASHFVNGYAIVGNFIDDELKYNFIDQNGNILFSNNWFDFADNFYDGFARVGVYKDNPYYLLDEKEILFYSYIDPEGNYLTYNSEKVSVPYARNFNDGMCVIATYNLYTSTKTYYKSYTFLREDSRNFLEDAIYFTAGQIPNAFFPGDLFALEETHIFKSGGNSGSWTVYYYYFDNVSSKYLFKSAKWVFDTDRDWITKIATDRVNKLGVSFENGVRYVTNMAKSPYLMSDFKRSKYFNCLVASVRIFTNNEGIIAFNYNEEDDSYTVSFIIDPLYENIIF